MGVKRVSNPPNPYESAHHEWLEPPPPVSVEVYEERARSILSENDSPDLPFRWSVNPYRGCQHACAYCYARPYHEYLGWGAGTDFDSKLVAKVNAPELLREAFSRRGWQGERVNFSGVTDCYQPLEAVYGLTRGCLEVCVEFANPVAIITKSYLVMRDAALLAKLDALAEAAVFQSIPFADDKVARLVEPQAPPPTKRFEAMRRLTEAGLRVGVMLAPIIPGLNDREIPAVLQKAAECGARWAGFMPIRLPRNVGPVFLQRIREAAPDRAERIEARIREIHGGELNDPRFGGRMEGSGEYWGSIEELFRVWRSRLGLEAPQRCDKRGRGPWRPPQPAVARTPGRVAGRQLRFDFEAGESGGAGDATRDRPL
ncbi:MAG: PA0069 family radical SAM protein [Phycisphaerae bacterium]